MIDTSAADHLVAYFDILGTKDRVRKGLFDDLHASDFAGPAATVADEFPCFRVAVLSDCAIFSAPTGFALDFLRAVNYLTSNWSADLVFVRGGIALGEIIWLPPPVRQTQLANFSCACVYGKALVEAFSAEQTSGPGIATFVTDGAAIFLEGAMPGSILRSQSNILVSFTQKEMNNWRRFYDDWLKRNAEDTALSLHLLATIRILDIMQESHVGVDFKPLFFP